MYYAGATEQHCIAYKTLDKRWPRGYSGIFKIEMLRLRFRASAPKIVSGLKKPKNNFFDPTYPKGD